jgi:flagellar basal body-associated protein FliL
MTYDSYPEDLGPRKGRRAAKALSAAALALVAVIATGTVVGLATGSRQRKLSRESNAAAAVESGRAVFDSIGTIRAKSADAKPAVVLATIAFPYDPSSSAFAEELGRKAPALKAAAMACLSRKKAAELSPEYEGAIKAALRDAFNGLLSLGKVDEIWLSDFAVIQ